MVKCFGGSRRLCSCFGPSAADVDIPSPTESFAVPHANAPQVKEPVTSGATELKSHPAAAAHKAGRLAITFSGGGFLLPYFIGVADALLQLGVLRLGGAATTNAATATTATAAGPTPLAGSSAGSLVAASLACGLTPARILDSFLDSVRDCRTNGSYRRLEEVLHRQLEATLPPDAAERCAGVATVCVTRLFPKPRTQRISAFASRSDLISSLMASCHIPSYFNGDVTTTYRGVRSVDGGVTSLMPVPTAPHDFLLKVCCFTRHQVARLPVFNRRRALQGLALGITPDAFRPWPYSFRYMLAAALHPRSDRFIRVLLEAGSHDGASWALAAGIAAEADLKRLTPLHLPPPLDGVRGPLEMQPTAGPLTTQHEAAAEAAAAALEEVAAEAAEAAEQGGSVTAGGGDEQPEAVRQKNQPEMNVVGEEEEEEVSDEEAGPGVVMAAAAALPALAGLAAAAAAADAAAAALPGPAAASGRRGSHFGGGAKAPEPSSGSVAVEPPRA
ncbi:hypothetical protein PLESTF_001545400 [Pleodorina starrii]|nr:hypothetical protein PLESTM_000749400 [Pleodorina starrii]GLC74693.1 hypothetical protein PLESTF_001545400 [Pleodorina starrii]